VLESLSQWTKCVFAKSRRCRMFYGCLVLCSMRLEVPYIAPRELGAVGAPFGRLWCTTGQWTVPDFLPFLPKSTVASHWSCGTPDSPVLPSDRWLSHVSPADRVVDRWLGTWLAHRTVRWIIAAAPWTFPESGQFAWASDIVRCTPDSPVHRRMVQVWLSLAKLLQFDFSHLLFHFHLFNS
jgi:hypothetical protein